jgi:hypothetical protein
VSMPARPVPTVLSTLKPTQSATPGRTLWPEGGSRKGRTLRRGPVAGCGCSTARCSGIHPRCRWKGSSNTAAKIRVRKTVMGKRRLKRGRLASWARPGRARARRTRRSRSARGSDTACRRTIRGFAAGECPRAARQAEGGTFRALAGSSDQGELRPSVRRRVDGGDSCQPGGDQLANASGARREEQPPLPHPPRAALARYKGVMHVRANPQARWTLVGSSETPGWRPNPWTNPKFEDTRGLNVRKTRGQLTLAHGHGTSRQDI